jgi:hypothetical protein
MPPVLHDGQFYGLDVESGDPCTITVRLSYRADEHSRKLTPATIRFTNVTSLASTIDFVRQTIHYTFGNISDWEPSEGRGMTFIHLCGGTIAVVGDAPVLQEIG